MGLISKTYTFTAGSTIVAAEHNTNFDTVYNEINGNIDNANIKSSAAIADTKLAAITTAGKVSAAAITSLASLPSGAGYLPLNNITGVALTGANSSITSITGLTTPLSLAQGGTAATNSNAGSGVCILNSKGHVATANLGSETANSTTFLRGDGTWQTPSNTSNVIFQFIGCADGDVGTGYGSFWGGVPSYNATGGSLGIFAQSNTTATIVRTKFKKIAGISTITFYAYVKSSVDETGNATNVQVTAANSVATASSTAPFNTLNWITAAVDVSTATNNTVYDVAVTMNCNNINRLAYLYSLIGIAS